jgi:peptide/nickel transport system substrate-binding protein
MVHTRSKEGLSRSGWAAVVALVIIVIIAGSLVAIHQKTSTTKPTSSQTTPTSSTSTPTVSATTSSATPTSTQTTTTTSAFSLQPPNRSVLVDDSQTAAPDALDPATGFFVQDNTVFLNVYQGLVEFTGFNYSQVAPVIAQNYTILNNYKTYVFNIRRDVWLSTGEPVNASILWFSFVREAYMGQAVGLANYGELTINMTQYSATGYAFPWGIRHAIQAATGLPTVSNLTLAVEALNNVLSNFNAANTTIQEIMSYPDQAYVVTGTYTFETNLLEPYRDWLLTLGGPWDVVVDPVYIDGHGGVQANKVNSYYDVNGGPGTGPYEIKYVAPGLTQVVLQANPNYWGKNASNLPVIAEPAHIPVVVINYGEPHGTRVEAFATNQAQISYVSIPFFNQMYSAYQYKQYYSFNQIFDELGYPPGFNYLGMNTQVFPTNITDFRLAIVHAINYTEILDKLYTYNGRQLAEEFLGPVSPGIQGFYNPDNLPLYSYNLSLAAYYLNLSGYQGHFYVVTPNGTILGDPNGNRLQPVTITYLAPISPLTESELEIIQAGLSQIGLSVAPQGVTASVSLTYVTPQASPPIQLLGWFPDWADPVLQEMVPLLTTSVGLPAWMNVTQVNKILLNLAFDTNLTQQIQETAWIYNFTYWYAPYAWLPLPVTYFFVQPYLSGQVFNFLGAYYYNTIQYT